MSNLKRWQSGSTILVWLDPANSTTADYEAEISVFPQLELALAHAMSILNEMKPGDSLRPVIFYQDDGNRVAGDMMLYSEIQRHIRKH
jgi:hypothetical protein